MNFIKNLSSVSEKRKRPGPLGPGILKSEEGESKLPSEQMSENALAFHESLIGSELRFLSCFEQILRRFNF
jgi:hypothetical protein